jgi:hypothetical protein
MTKNRKELNLNKQNKNSVTGVWGVVEEESKI